MADEKSPKILRIITRLNIVGPAQHAVFLSEGLNNGFLRSKLVFGTVDLSEGDMSYLVQEKEKNLKGASLENRRRGTLRPGYLKKAARKAECVLYGGHSLRG